MPTDNAFDQILAGITGDDAAAQAARDHYEIQVGPGSDWDPDDQRDYAEEAYNAELLANPDPEPEQVAAAITTDANSRIAQAAWAAANPELCTGRGPTGRLRNFPAMRDEKLEVTLRAVEDEANDPEALDNLLAEAQHRGLR